MKSKLSAAKTPDRKVRGTKREAPGSPRAKRVFIVEDHPVLRETLVEIVDREKDLTVCGQAGAANRAFKAIGRARPDLVLVDITLPGKSGLELVKELRATDGKIKLLVVSMHDAALYADRVVRSEKACCSGGESPPSSAAGAAGVQNESNEWKGLANRPRPRVARRKDRNR